jgi:cyclophilin family peptidyl-prolyl cis-trans isomerase
MSPPYTNLGLAGNFGKISNEFGVGKRYSNAYGTIAMAKVAGDTNSATSQFYFNLTDNPGLDTVDSNNMFVVFGHVLRGTNILNQFNGFSNGNHIVNLTGLFPTLPTETLGTNPPPYNELMYYSITILGAQVNLTTNGARQISWASINGLTNNLEYTTNLSSPWHVLVNPVGNGSGITVTDTNTVDAERFYRVHILY